jgi:hypothetical protein
MKYCYQTARLHITKDGTSMVFAVRSSNQIWENIGYVARNSIIFVIHPSAVPFNLTLQGGN